MAISKIKELLIMDINKTFIKAENESEKLGKASFGAMAGVLFSRASGVVRTAIVNATFGLGVSLDAFNSAFRFPNSLRDLFADGALSAAFVKVLIEEKDKGTKAEKELIAIVIGFFSIITFSIAIIAAIFSYPFMSLFSSDEFKNSGGLELSSNLFKILAFYLPFTMLNAVAMAILSIMGLTFRAMNSSAFLNVGIIGSALCSPLFLAYGVNPIYSISLGAMLGVIIQMIYQFIPIYKLGLITYPNFNIKDWASNKSLHKILLLMFPRAIAQGSLIIALMINTFYAIQLGSGVLSYIITATMIIQVPIGLFGVATGFAAHPILTKAIHEKNFKKFSKLLTESLETTLWLAAMTTICFAIFIVPFYSILFQHGKVILHDTIQNSIAVCSYSIGIIFGAGSKILLNAFYAINSTKQIIYNAIIYLIINATLSSILAPIYGVIGLGISYSTATAFDFFMNYFYLRKMYFNKKFGNSPYIEGGNFFHSKIIIFSICAYLFGILGIISAKYFWNNFNNYFNFKLNFITNLSILIIGGIIFITLIIVVIKFFGPIQLKILLEKFIKKRSILK